MIRDRIRDRVREAIRRTYGIRDVPSFDVRVPDNSKYGDYAVNAAFCLAKILKKSPVDIAHELAHECAHEQRMTVEESGGFLNFRFSEKFLQKEFLEIVKKKNRYGRGRKKTGKTQVEFISANPTGPLTLANGRGGFWGDVLSNVLEHQGYAVEREYYSNDAGNQIRMFGLSFLAVLGIEPDSDSYYHGTHIAAWARKNKKIVEKLRRDPEGLGRRAARDFMKLVIQPGIRKNMKISFDRWTSEYAHIRKKKYPEKFLQQARGYIYEKDGALWLRTTEFGDDKDRALKASDGSSTYFLADAGHYLETARRGFVRKINILGADHYGYVARIQAAAKIVGLKSEVIVMQLVRLISGGKEMRMSKRKGVFATIDELINDVGLDAVRYFFLERAPETHMDFNMDLAKERSVKNPVYYIQYAHARCESIRRKVKNKKIKSKNVLSFLIAPEERELIKKMIQFPEVVSDTAGDYHVHRLPQYAYEVARLFHNFYEKHRVITDDNNVSGARCVLVGATQIILQNILRLLGISAPKKM